MSVSTLHKFLEARCLEVGISPRRASILAVNSPDFIRHMKEAKNAPKTDKLLALAKVLDINPVDLLSYLDGSPNDAPNAVSIDSHNFAMIEVVGAVQAGVFTEALEWEHARKYSVTMPLNDGFPLHLKRYALEVKGESMNKVFPDGSWVSVISYADLGKSPETGDYVVTFRRSSCTPGFEATIKALQIRQDGSVCLWPQSNDPNFQQPLIIPPLNEDYSQDAGAPDVEIRGLVVGALKTGLKAKF